MLLQREAFELHHEEQRKEAVGRSVLKGARASVSRGSCSLLAPRLL